MLQYQYNIKQTSDKNKEKYRLGDYKLIQYQILQINIIRTVWQTVRIINNEILGFKGLIGFSFHHVLLVEVTFTFEQRSNKNNQCKIYRCFSISYNSKNIDVLTITKIIDMQNLPSLKLPQVINIY